MKQYTITAEKIIYSDVTFIVHAKNEEEALEKIGEWEYEKMDESPGESSIDPDSYNIEKVKELKE